MMTFLRDRWEIAKRDWQHTVLFAFIPCLVFIPLSVIYVISDASNWDLLKIWGFLGLCVAIFSVIDNKDDLGPEW